MSSAVRIILVLLVAAFVADAAAHTAKRHHVSHRLSKALGRQEPPAGTRQPEFTLHNIGTVVDPTCVAGAAWCGIICPIVNARLQDNSFGYFTAPITNLMLEISTCFVATPARFAYFMNARFPVITRGNFMHNSINIPVRIANVGGDVVAILGHHNTATLTSYLPIITRPPVRNFNADDYYNRPFCNLFSIRMAAAIRQRNATRINALQTQINSCTSLRVWGQIQRETTREAEKNEILKSSVELAGKVVPLVLEAAGAVTGGVALAIDLTVDIIVKSATLMSELSKTMGASTNGARTVVLAVCRAYQVPLQMALTYGQTNELARASPAGAPTTALAAATPRKPGAGGGAPRPVAGGGAPTAVAF